MIVEKAKYFHVELGQNSECLYSSGCLRNFKTVRVIHCLKSSGEKKSADYESATFLLKN